MKRKIIMSQMKEEDKIPNEKMKQNKHKQSNS